MSYSPYTAVTRAHPLLRWLHWLMALAIAAALAFVYSRGWFAKDSPPHALLTQSHMLAGLTVLALLLPLLATRLVRPLPPITPAPAGWLRALARLTHALLYFGMLLTPLLGFLYVEAGGHPVRYLGFTLPTLIGADQPRAQALRELHEALGLALLYLALLHAAAALWHHRIVRDNTLARML